MYYDDASLVDVACETYLGTQCRWRQMNRPMTLTQSAGCYIPACKATGNVLLSTYTSIGFYTQFITLQDIFKRQQHIRISNNGFRQGSRQGRE